MKNIKFYLIIAALALGIVYIGIKYLDKSKEADQLTKAKASVSKQIQTEANVIARKVGENGIATVLFDITGHKATPEQAASTAGTKGIIDTTAMALDIRTKQLKQILVVKSSLEAENLKLKKQLDQYNRPYYTYSGNGLDLKFTPPNDLDTNARADFKADVKISATQYWQRKWFLGAKKSILAVTSDNPIYKVNGADFVEFEQKQPAFGLRIQASGNYNPQTGVVGYGPAARIDAGRFSFQGNYTYYPDYEHWRPSVNVNYDLIRF
ncbi:hypothetical protein [Pedobacter sp.]|uniref:hypothetical protein n=1 Tax=Pedobacter sp. TaxID=1411316 RepID=UPI003D7FCBFF